MKQTYYVVFERTQGAKCWTLAHKDSDTPACFRNINAAEDWVANVHSKRKGWWGGKPDQRPMQSHIAVIELPE